MNRTSRLIAVYLGLGVGGAAAYWLYLYLENPDEAPTWSDLVETIFSYFQRGAIIVRGEALQAVGAASYLDIATTFLAKHEGFSPRAYQDAGHLAIGYGHDIVDGDGLDENSVLTESEGADLLQQDLLSRDDCIANSVSVALSDTQRAALLSFVYNVGCSAFQTSTMLKYINTGNFDAAANEFQRWIYSQGSVNATLQSRRVDEQDLFES